MAEQRLIAAASVEKVTVEHIEDRELSSRGSSSSGASPKDSTEAENEDAGLLENSPTEEEKKTLRRVPDKIPLKVFTIAFIELCERFSYYGSAVVVITNFIQQELPAGSVTGAGGPDGQSGALGMGQRASTGIVTFNQFWQYFLPIFGAYIADAHWGRYKTITAALGVDIVGHCILVMAAIPPVIVNPTPALVLMVVAIITIGIGTGGFKPNISPLIVEQVGITRMRVETVPATGERVIVDPAVTINRVYNWFYFFINVGSLVGQLSMVYAEKYVGFYLSFSLPTVMLCLCPLVMWWGRNRYARRDAAGSVLKPALRTFFLAQKGRWSVNPVKTWKNMHDGTFWESVKPSNFAPGTKPAWMNFDDAWVDELRRGYSACAVFAWFPIYWLTYNQLNSNLVSQAAVLKLNGLPNDLVTNLNPLTLIVFIPLCDFVIYPFLRKMNIRFTPIKKITAGFFLGSAAMIWAAGIQHAVYMMSPCGYEASTCDEVVEGSEDNKADIIVWAQSGAYVLIALSEIFASITALEYAFSKAPKNMRSMVQAVVLFTSALSAALSQAWTGLSADPLLVYNYGSIAAVAAVAGVLFWFQFRGLDAEEDSLNELGEGRVYNKNDGSEEHQGGDAAAATGAAASSISPQQQQHPDAVNSEKGPELRLRHMQTDTTSDSPYSPYLDGAPLTQQAGRDS